MADLTKLQVNNQGSTHSSDLPDWRLAARLGGDFKDRLQANKKWHFMIQCVKLRSQRIPYQPHSKGRNLSITLKKKDNITEL